MIDEPKPSAIEVPELQHAQEPPDAHVKVSSMDERAQIHQLCEVMRMTFGPWQEHMVAQGAFPNSDSILATAAVTYAGVIIGQMVTIGAVKDSDKDAVANMMVRNFRNGWELGKKHAARAAERVMAEMAAEQGTEREQ